MKSKAGKKIKNILKTLLSYVLVLLGLSILVFVLVRVMPGDTARMALGARATEEAVESLREEMHLNDPYITQYMYWLKDILHGNFGTSIISKRPVLDDIKYYLPATIELALLASVLTAVFGLILGVLATKYNGKWQDMIVRIGSYMGIVAPAFLWAVLALLLFGYKLPILPIQGRISAAFTEPVPVTHLYVIDYLLEGNPAGAWDAFKHLIMPAVVLSFAGISQEARITRSSMVDNLDKPYASAERAYGIPERKILFKYLLKPSMNATISVLAMDIATLFGGSFLVESVFNYPGLSRYGLQAMLNKDVFAISAVVLYTGVLFIIFNFLTDVVIGLVDPRVKFARKGQ